MKHFSQFARGFLVVIGLSFSPTITASIITWTGAGSNDLWANPSNWDALRLPTSSDTVFNFYGDFIKITNGVNAEAKYFDHIGELIIEIGGSLTLEELKSKGDLTNKGTITVNNSPKYGIFHSSQTSQNQLFLNEGEIYIDNAAWAGLCIRNDQTFTNKPGALIEITNSGEENLLLQGTLQNIGTLRMTGAGNNIGLKVDSEDVADPAFLSNDACAKVVVLDQIVIGEGSITNFGFFRQNYDGNNSIGIHQFLNQGFLEDIQTSFDFSHIDKKGVWLKKLFFLQPKAGDPIQVFDNNFEAPVTENLSNVYNDKNLTSLAGTLDFTTGLWTPNGNATSDSTFFMEATTVSGICIDTVRFDTDLKVLDVNYWVGGASGSWNNATNWSKVSVPIASDNVGIFDSTAVVTMPLSYTAVGQTLFLKGRLTVNSSSNLNIQGSGLGIGIDINHQGELINNGIINLVNYEFGANLKGGKIINNASLFSTDNELGFYLISHDNKPGTLENHGTITTNTGNVITASKSLIQNFGSINANIGSADYGISGDTLYNRGNIVIEGMGISSGRGISGVVFNDTNGSIETRQLLNGLDIEGSNRGTLTSENTGTGITISDDFTNKSGGTISILNSTRGVSTSSGIFTNEEGGTITTNNCQSGVVINNIINNRGDIQILSTSQDGILILGDLENRGTGLINIENTSNHGIILQGQTADLINDDSAMITITQAGGYGILVQGAEISNTGSAKIIVDPTGLDHLRLMPYTNFTTIYNASLTNGGSIWLKD